jgi:hypothetical protein
LFSDSTEGAETSVIISIIKNTAAANNLDAYKYFEYIFRNLPNSSFLLESSVLKDCLSWADKV